MKSNYFLYLAWTQSLLAVIGSLFFSEILKYTPCILCWYQRIGLYPTLPILTLAIVSKTRDFTKYIYSLFFFSLPIAIYHNLLYYKIIPDTISPCATGVSCTTRFVEYFGFITIPLLSLLAHLVIIICLELYKKYERRS